MILFHLKETFGIKYSVNFSHFEWLWVVRGWRGLKCLKCLPKWWHEQIIDRYRWRCNKRWKVAWKRQVAADSSALCRPILNIFLPVLTSCLAGYQYFQFNHKKLQGKQLINSTDSMIGGCRVVWCKIECKIENSWVRFLQPPTFLLWSVSVRPENLKLGC